jgi:hypothetical protein
MARRKYQMDEKKIARFIKEGRGQGEGPLYNPWLHVNDLPSRGRVHRVYCPKTGRTHHLLSDNEYYEFLQLWWDENITDIREQFPLLNRRETFELAALRGIKYPLDPTSGTLWVITTDFLVTSRSGNFEAIAVKQEEELSNDRAIEKLEIEWCYWQKRNVPWQIITNRQVKCTFTRNLAWILDADQSLYLDVGGSNIDVKVYCELIQMQREQPLMPIRVVCTVIDQHLGYRPGTALASLRRLLGAKIIHVDLYAKKIQELPAQAFDLNRGLLS